MTKTFHNESFKELRGFTQFATIFFQSLICADFFLFLRLTQIFLGMCSKIALCSLLGQPGFCLIFILSKNKGFQPGAILHPSSSSMRECDPDIQKNLSLKKHFFSSKITKTLKKSKFQRQLQI